MSIRRVNAKIARRRTRRVAQLLQTVQMETLPKIQPQHLAEVLDVPLRTAQRWMQRKQLPRPYRRLWALLRDLGELWPNAKRFVATDDGIITDEGNMVTWRQMRAMPYLIQALAEHQRTTRELRERLRLVGHDIRQLPSTDAPLPYIDAG